MSKHPLDYSATIALPPNTDPDWGKQLGEACNFERAFGALDIRSDESNAEFRARLKAFYGE